MLIRIHNLILAHLKADNLNINLKTDQELDTLPPKEDTMRGILPKLMITAMALCLFSLPVLAGVSIGMTVDDGKVSSFRLAIGEHFRTSQSQVTVVVEKDIPDDELPVVFFFARHASVKPGVIVDLRLKGKSWWDIAAHYHLGADLFYVPVEADGPPYGRALGHYKNKPRKHWNKIVLADRDVINLVNLKFISDHYGCSPSEVVKQRQGKKSFVDIGENARKNRNKKLMATKANDGKKDKTKGKEKVRARNSRSRTRLRSYL